MKGCPNCVKLEAHIAELNLALEGAVFVTEREIPALMQAFKLGSQAAMILGVLARANTSVSRRDLNIACAARQPGSSRERLDASEVTGSYAGVQIHRIRAALGKDAIHSRVCHGYTLSPAVRRRVLDVIGDQP